MQIETKNSHPEEDVKAIHDGLTAYNFSRVERDYEPFMVTVKDAGIIIGGAQCASVWNWMFVKLLWVKEDLHRQGLGTRIMSVVEKEARDRGCIGIHLDTFEFQALGFYQKLGFEIFGEIEDHPKGYKRHYLKKRLD